MRPLKSPLLALLVLADHVVNALRFKPRRYRVRRGKVVEIPLEWAGVGPRPQQIRKRDSKLTRKLRRMTKGAGFKRREFAGPEVSEWDGCES